MKAWRTWAGSTAATDEEKPIAAVRPSWEDGRWRVVPPGFVIGHGFEVRGRSACPDRLVAGTMGA